MPETPPKRVLVADRNQIILALARHILSRQGHAVDLADDVATAEAQLRRNTYDAVLIEATLSGASWMRSMIDAHPATRVIAMVTDGEADSLPVSATLKKPLELDTLAFILDSDDS